MTNVIVAFSEADDAKSIKNILMKHGFSVVAVCTSGSQAINCLDGLDGGIIISGYRFEDMLFREVHDCLNGDFEMLLMASAERLSGNVPDDIVCLAMPLKVHDLVHTLGMMVEEQNGRRKRQRLQPKERNGEELQFIDRAKAVLMERNNMTESEAHRYIQKSSMDNGTNLVETARMILSLITIG